MNGRPPWERLAVLLADVDDRAARTPAHLRARIDQVDAEVRDFFDDRGLCTADEWVAYTALVTCDLFAGQALNAHRHQLIDLRGLNTVHSLLVGNAGMFATAARTRT